MPALCVGLGDRGERGCLAGSGDGAHERDRARVGDHAADERALLVAEREAALVLRARDADRPPGPGRGRVGAGRVVVRARVMRCSAACRLRVVKRCRSSGTTCSRREERVGRGEQGVAVGRRAERERELAHDVAAREGGVALGQAVLAEELLEDAAESASVERSWRVATGREQRCELVCVEVLAEPRACGGAIGGFVARARPWPGAC